LRRLEPWPRATSSHVSRPPVPAAFSSLGFWITPFCCAANINMLPCKHGGCLWYLVYIVCLQNAASRCTRQVRGHHVQNRFYRPCAFRHPVQPPDDLDRPPLDEERRDCHPQRRFAVFRALIRRPRGTPRARPDRPASDPPQLRPRFSGVFFCLSAESTPASTPPPPHRPCDILHRTEGLRSGISHTNMGRPPTLAEK
jgi:hypothetical protein